MGLPIHDVENQVGLLINLEGGVAGWVKRVVETRIINTGVKRIGGKAESVAESRAAHLLLRGYAVTDDEIGISAILSLLVSVVGKRFHRRHANTRGHDIAVDDGVADHDWRYWR